MFFRDDGLSDMIGFEYQQWNAGDAAADFGQHLRNIANYLGDRCNEHVVSVILDGENAWEYYRDNAFHFIGALYETLANSAHIHRSPSPRRSITARRRSCRHCALAAGCTAPSPPGSARKTRTAPGTCW